MRCRQNLRILRPILTFPTPVNTIAGDIDGDALWPENPRKGIEIKVDADAVYLGRITEVDDGIESVAPEAEPVVAVVKDASLAVCEVSCVIGRGGGLAENDLPVTSFILSEALVDVINPT